MSFTINIDKNSKLILYKHTGFIKKEAIGEAWEEFLSMKEFTELKYNLLSDYTEATFDITTNDADFILDFLFDIKDLLKDKKQALVIADPYSTALSFIFEKQVLEKVRFKVKVFSTREAALAWLI